MAGRGRKTDMGRKRNGGLGAEGQEKQTFEYFVVAMGLCGCGRPPSPPG